MEFEQLIARHKDAVYRQMVRMCGNADDADDVLSEALLSAYRSLHQLSDDSAFRGWLAIIARRTCGRLKRKEALAPVLHLADLEEQGKAVAIERASPETLALEAETKECLLRTLKELPPMYREVYELRDIQDLPAGEVAEKLGISVAAVKSRLHRARAMIREGIDCALGT